MKKTTAVLAAALAAALAAPAIAKPTTAPAPAATPATAPAVSSAAAAPAAAGTDGVNPFLGNPLSFEGAKQQLEMAKVQSQLLDEKVKQRNAEIDLQQLPKKREAELRKLMGEGVASIPGGLPSIQVDGAAPTKPAKHRKSAARAKAGAAKAQTPTAAVMPPPPSVEVLGMSDSPDGASAMVSINGNVASVKTGDLTPLGRVQISGDRVLIGAGSYSLHHATLARMAMPSDSAPAAATPGTSGGAPNMTPPGAIPGGFGGMGDMLRNAGPATSRGPLPPGLAPIVR